MDFGAGTGLITSQIADKVEKLTAVDVSLAMLDKLMAKEELQGKVEALCSNILEQPLAICFERLHACSQFCWFAFTSPGYFRVACVLHRIW
jgi:16S rRNA A1518/A1519 N6-dimethyltransferase RsmA/KsgA/DIM1 with predicted DNA glycosylase/AP lyase activity